MDNKANPKYTEVQRRQCSQKTKTKDWTHGKAGAENENETIGESLKKVIEMIKSSIF